VVDGRKVGGVIDELVDSGRVPEPLLRTTIRGLLRARRAGDGPSPDALADMLWSGPVTIAVDAANAQHYEVPAEFFVLCLGPRLKYSSCLYPPGVDDLALAEDAMLALTCERARLEDGQDVLELGCGWGSLTLWMAERYPASRITAVSNSAGQRAHIEARARERGLANVTVVTADVSGLELDSTAYDRVVSVEML